MPVYEYVCEDCGKQFEELVTLSEAGRGAKCPKCGSKSLRRLMSTFASVSSGSGGASEGPTCANGVCNL